VNTDEVLSIHVWKRNGETCQIILRWGVAEEGEKWRGWTKLEHNICVYGNVATKPLDNYNILIKTFFKSFHVFLWNKAYKGPKFFKVLRHKLQVPKLHLEPSNYCTFQFRSNAISSTLIALTLQNLFIFLMWQWAIPKCIILTIFRLMVSIILILLGNRSLELFPPC
jgi:hypothetical protein